MHVAVAGLSVPHFHQHVFARGRGTSVDVPWYASGDDVRGSEAEIDALCARLAQSMSSTSVPSGTD